MIFRIVTDTYDSRSMENTLAMCTGRLVSRLTSQRTKKFKPLHKPEAATTEEILLSNKDRQNRPRQNRPSSAKSPHHVITSPSRDRIAPRDRDRIAPRQQNRPVTSSPPHHVTESPHHVITCSLFRKSNSLHPCSRHRNMNMPGNHCTSTQTALPRPCCISLLDTAHTPPIHSRP